jgi:hypothetical protein
MAIEGWVGVLSSLFAAIGGYFVMREKVNRLENDVSELREGRDKFVTFTHFDAVILPLRNTLDSVQVDIKLLLKMIAKEKT